MLRHFRRSFSIFNKLCAEEKFPNAEKITELLDDAVTYPERSQKSEWSTLPYPEGVVFSSRNQGHKAPRAKTDPRDTSIILFPGQGAQFVGMGAKVAQIPEVRDMFELANHVLKYDLLDLCLHGPKNKLDMTIYAQPAILVTSLACLEKLKEERPNAIDNCVATAGFSLGEITALIFAGAIPFDQGLRLVQIRAEAMQMAADEIQGGMMTLLYGPDSKVKQALKAAKDWCINKGIENPDCLVANYLYPHCKVIAGNEEALDFIEKNAKEFNIKRTKRLPVSGAFHSALMEPALEAFKKAIRKCKIEDPLIPVHSNVDGMPYRNAEHVRKQLPKQMVKPVKWEQLLHILYERKQGEHFPRTFEVGPGRGLKTIIKQVNAKAWDSSFNIEP